MTMKWKKKPVVVDVFKLENTLESIIDALEFVYNVGMETSVESVNAAIYSVREDKGFTIPTLEGVVKANFGDYIVKNDEHKFMVYTYEAFHAIYERHLVWDENL